MFGQQNFKKAEASLCFFLARDPITDPESSRWAVALSKSPGGRRAIKKGPRNERELFFHKNPPRIQ
ncbi:MAG: hypothetical protein ACI83P_001139 [Janthinobacterium sp.]